MIKPNILGITITGSAVFYAAIAAIFYIALTTCASAKTVRNDSGGVLDERVTEIAHLRATGEQVRIGGYCNSACTMYLGLPNACVSPRAVFGFHGPMSQFYGMPLLADEFEHWSRVMASHYPEPIRTWYMQEARYALTDTRDVTGRTLIKLGAAKAC